MTLGEECFRFLFDSGIGVNVVAPTVAERLDLPPVGETFKGQRMSGQWVEAPLVYLPSVTVDGEVLRDQMAAVMNLGGESGDDGFSGILGLSPFDGIPVTVDPGSSTLTLNDHRSATYRVPLDIKRSGPSTDPFAELVLTDGSTIHVEVDTGSESLILDSRFLAGGQVEIEGAPEVREGIDQTGNPWRRQLGRLKGGVHLQAAPDSRQDQPAVIFQDIIHDGLVGTDYLNRFRYTIDVKREALSLTPLGAH